MSLKVKTIRAPRGTELSCKGWVQEAARLSVPVQRRLWKESSDAALKAVEEAGVTIIHPDKKAFQDAVVSMHDKYKGTAIGELMQEIAEIKE